MIGGGATGLGAAVEAAARGYRTLLVERSDFAKETSSRSTKLVHGGVRYLAADEPDSGSRRVARARPHAAQRAASGPRSQLCRSRLQLFFASLLRCGPQGLRAALRQVVVRPFASCSPAKTLSKSFRASTSDRLRGGILYHDGQFDDARYAIALLRTLQDLGGAAINYVEATGLMSAAAKSSASRRATWKSGADFDLQAKAVINACGVHAEETIALNGRPATNRCWPSARARILFCRAASCPAIPR